MPRRKGLLVLFGVALLFVAGAAVVLPFLSLSARGEPGPMETFLATRAKRFLVSRSAGVLDAPAATETTLEEGFGLYSGSCASCHGVKGRKPTEVGRALYPPAVDLGAPGTQQYSDAELFWIIQNGIRLTGMPAFGEIHSNEELWQVVHYLRSLGEGTE